LDIENYYQDTSNNNNFACHTSGVGTLAYASPEQTAGNAYDYKVDIYSLGIVLFECLCPFNSPAERAAVLTDLRNGIYPHKLYTEFPQESNLIMWMISANPEDRPNAAQILGCEPLQNFLY